VPEFRNRRFRFEQLFFGSAALVLGYLILHPQMAVGSDGALKVYGSGKKAKFNQERV